MHRVASASLRLAIISFRNLLPIIWSAVLVLFAWTPAAAWNPDGVPLCSAPGGQSYARIVAAGDGGFNVAWSDLRAPSARMFATRLNPGGAPLWARNGVDIDPPRGWGCAAIASDGSGGIFAGSAILYDASRQSNIAIYLQHVDASGAKSWADPGLLVCLADGERSVPEMIGDGEGGVVLAWEDDRDWISAGRPSGVYAQRVSASGVPLWTSNGVRVSTAVGWQRDPALVTDGSGGAFVAASISNGGAVAGPRVQHVLADGQLAWPAEGVALTPLETGPPSLVSNQRGGVIAGWQSRYPDRDIFAQRIDENGAVLWGENGQQVCVAANAQTQPMLVADGEGGAILVWGDMRRWNTRSADPPQSDIYAQRIDASGHPLWEQNGIALTSSGMQDQPQIAQDGQGGALLAWLDETASPATLRAQHLSSQGEPQWESAGRIVSTTAAFRVVLFPAQRGSAIVVWTDVRNDPDGDLFAQRLGPPDPGQGKGPAAAKPTFHIQSITPNPSAGTFRVSLAVQDGLPATLELLDVLGRRVTSREFAPSGGSLIEVELKPGATPAAGIYLVRLRQGDRSETRRVVVR